MKALFAAIHILGLLVTALGVVALFNWWPALREGDFYFVIKYAWGLVAAGVVLIVLAHIVRVR